MIHTFVSLSKFAATYEYGLVKSSALRLLRLLGASSKMVANGNWSPVDGPKEIKQQACIPGPASSYPRNMVQWYNDPMKTGACPGTHLTKALSEAPGSIGFLGGLGNKFRGSELCRIAETAGNQTSAQAREAQTEP